MRLDEIPDSGEGVVHKRGPGEYDYVRSINKIFGALVAIPDFHTEAMFADVIPAQVRDADVIGPESIHQSFCDGGIQSDQTDIRSAVFLEQ